MEIQKIIYGNDRICKAIIKGDSDNEYVTSIDGDSGITWCTCPWWVLNKRIKTCKHILYLLDNLEYDKMKPTKRFKNFLSECLTIDTLMGSGFPVGSITALFGQSGQGKTLLTAQLALSCIKNLDKDVIVIETEGNREQDYLELLLKFAGRFGLTEEEICKRIHFYTVMGDLQDKAIFSLLGLIGYKAELDASKKGDKFTVTYKEVKPKLKDELLKDVGLIIVDSLTKPIKVSVGHKTQNLPARANLIGRFFDRLYQMAYKFDIAVIVVHHACHDISTKTLIKEKGIVNYTDVEIGDKVLALDKNGNRIWSNVEKIHVYDYDGEMIHIHGKSMSQLVTPNHRVMWLDYKGRIRYKEAENISNSGFNIPKSSTISQIPLTKDYLVVLSEKYPKEFLQGWYLAEGYLDKENSKRSRWGCRFCLNRNDLEWVETPLDTMGIPHWRSKEEQNEIQLGISRKSIYEDYKKFGRLAYNKVIPDDIIESYNNEQLLSLLGGYLLGDGSKCATTGTWNYTTTSMKLVESLIKLCTKVGYSINYNTRPSRAKTLPRQVNDFRESYYGYIRTNNKGWGYPSRVNYNDKVWCLTTEHGNFIVIRDGQVSFSGNSVDPLKWGRDFGKTYGGDEVWYNSKYILQLIDSDMSSRAKYGKTARRVLLLKHPYNTTNGELFPVNLKEDWGFCDED